MTPPEFTKKTVSSFLSLIEKTKKAELDSGKKDDFIFRGQSTDAPLIPKIARLKPKGSIDKIESLILDEFARVCPPFLEFDYKDGWSLIALAQHHGLPTRLLDWSYSALAALWFCVQKPPQRDENGILQDGVVWLLKTTVKDFMPSPTDEVSLSKSKTEIFRSRHVSRRILTQAGLFTCHWITKNGKFIPLENNTSFKDRLIKINIPSDCFFLIRDQLNACGVNKSSLFPDLDGLAGHLQFRFFHDWSLLMDDVQNPIPVLRSDPKSSLGFQFFQQRANEWGEG